MAYYGSVSLCVTVVALLSAGVLLLSGVFRGPVGMDGEVRRLLALTGGEHASLGRAAAFLGSGAGPPVTRCVGGRRLLVAHPASPTTGPSLNPSFSAANKREKFLAKPTSKLIFHPSLPRVVYIICST